MTTEAAARQYLSEHLAQCQDRGWAVVNPQGLPFETLPIIYGFNNGGSPGWFDAVLLAADGTFLGSRLCSDEGYMPHDLGILDDSRPDRHETFSAHYPNGYRMEFVSHSDVDSHAGLQAAIAIAMAAPKAIADQWGE